MKATAPAGVEAVPTPAVSLTKAVQLVACPTTTDAGEQLTVVVVCRRLTVTAALEPELVL